jgi:hypothetical protein
MGVNYFLLGLFFKEKKKYFFGIKISWLRQIDIFYHRGKMDYREKKLTATYRISAQTKYRNGSKN